MIIESHAHYNIKSFQGTFRYLAMEQDRYAIRESDLPQLLDELSEAGIPYSIEPGITLESNREVLDFCGRYPGRIFPAVGVHPTRCFAEKWADRSQLEGLSRSEGVIAIGETGLDYHHKREDQHRLTQHRWFLYQLNLARKRKLPLVLHIRQADRDALRVLRLHPARKLGGVVHCFNGSWDIARQYLDLGFCIGIGGAALQKEERAGQLWEAIRNMPLDRIVLETDAPYVLPDCKEELQNASIRKVRNTSLILPEVARKIAELKGITPQEVEKVTAQNVIRVFHLPIDPEELRA